MSQLDRGIKGEAPTNATQQRAANRQAHTAGAAKLPDPPPYGYIQKPSENGTAYASLIDMVGNKVEEGIPIQIINYHTIVPDKYVALEKGMYVRIRRPTAYSKTLEAEVMASPGESPTTRVPKAPEKVSSFGFAAPGIG